MNIKARTQKGVVKPYLLLNFLKKTENLIFKESRNNLISFSRNKFILSQYVSQKENFIVPKIVKRLYFQIFKKKMILKKKRKYILSNMLKKKYLKGGC